MAGLIDRQLLNGGLGRARDSDHDMAAAEGLLTANEREGMGFCPNLAGSLG